MAKVAEQMAGISAGVEVLLPTGTDSPDVQRSGLMDTPPPPQGHSAQALARWNDGLQSSPKSRRGS